VTVTDPAPEEVYICDLCGEQVTGDRVLVLTSTGQVGRHADCHEFGKAMH
jgi:ribosome-binding protein aMBF1 (putative translation factor)